MKSKLREIDTEEIRKIAKDQDLLNSLKREEKFFIVSSSKGNRGDRDDDPLLDMEITLRKCEKVGLFKQ